MLSRAPLSKRGRAWIGALTLCAACWIIAACALAPLAGHLAGRILLAVLP